VLRGTESIASTVVHETRTTGDGHVTSGDRRLSPEEAKRLWKRAVELQTEAADALEGTGRKAAATVGHQIGADFALAEVKEAAAAAGIEPRFVDRALAESDDAHESGSARSRLTKWLLGRGAGLLVASRRFESPPKAVHDALLATFATHDMTLIEVGEPVGDGGSSLSFALCTAKSSDPDYMRDLRRAGVREVHVCLEPSGADGCVVTLSAAAGQRAERKVTLGAAGAAAAGVVGGWGFGAMSAFATLQLGVGGVLGGTAIGAAMLLGTATGSGLGLRVTRNAQRLARRHGKEALDRLLQLAGVRLQHRTLDSAAGPSLPTS
jgi:hypothetical protein